MTARSLLARTVPLATVALLTPPASAVCQVPQPRIVCAEYANSKAVVIATLRATRYVDIKSNDTDGHVYSVTVKTLFRGDVGPKFEIWEENSSGRAAFDWNIGTDYLLFVAAYSQHPVRGWLIDGCGNSGPVSRSAAALSAVKSAQASRSEGIVYGMVNTDSWTTGVPGVVVEAVGNQRTYSAKTDQGGRFQLQLPDGHYVLNAILPGSSFQPEPFSYENPRDLRIAPGYCAQVQFSQK